jgi:hypothetical protein
MEQEQPRISRMNTNVHQYHKSGHRISFVTIRVICVIRGCSLMLLSITHRSQTDS